MTRDDIGGAKEPSHSEHDQLAGVPGIEQFESFASWVTRAALSQGTDNTTFLDYVGIDTKRDVDIDVTRNQLRRVAELTGQNPSQFALVYRMFSAVHSIDPTGRKFLLFNKGRTPRYRYCPVCLHEQRISHFPLHWRFYGWRHCPLHNCMMEDRCRKCGSYVLLSRSLIAGGRERRGIGYLHQCFRCELNLSEHWNVVKDTACGDLVRRSERIAMNQGRAVLSALYHGYFLYAGSLGQQYPLTGLLRMEERGELPHFGFLLDADEVLRRNKIRERIWG
jgi:TniQ